MKGSHMSLHSPDKGITVSIKVIPALITVLLHTGQEPGQRLHKCVIVHDRIPLITLQPALRVAVMLSQNNGIGVQMTWPGAPTVYYGDEAGVCGFTDPDNRRTYPWGHEDQMMIAFHRDMIKIHKEYGFLSNGSLVFLWNDYQGLCFGRFSHDERMIVILNNRNEDREVEIEVWKTGISRLRDSVLKRIMLSYRDGYTTEEYEYTAKAGVIKVPMPAFGAMVLYHKCENPTIFVEEEN